jgi:membrane fusion protein (multidrug efflux system)
MPPEVTEHSSESSSIDAPATAKAGAAVDRDGKSPPTDSASKTVPPARQRFTRRRMLLAGVLCAVVIAAAVYGIPWIRFVLSTVSTDDAFVNGHVTFVAPRVHGEVARVLVDARDIAQRPRGGFRIAREQQDVVLPLMISLSMVMLDVFA